MRRSVHNTKHTMKGTITKEIHAKEGVKLTPQCKRILNHIEKRGSITALEALGLYGVMRLPARICDLRNKGIRINTEMVERFNKYAEKVHVAKYTLAKEPM